MEVYILAKNFPIEMNKFWNTKIIENMVKKEVDIVIDGLKIMNQLEHGYDQFE